MVYKRYLLIFLLLTGFLGIPSCLLKDCEVILPYWDISKFKLSLRDLEWNEHSDQVFSGDTLNIIFEFEHEFQAQNTSPFMNSCMATQPCPSPGEGGPKDMISSVEITSETAFDEYLPGELLNSLIQGTPIPMLILDDWVTHLNNSWTPYSTIIFFSKKPKQQLQRTFTVKLIFNSGKAITETTQPIIW
jgi:hypothetical protein